MIIGEAIIGPAIQPLHLYLHFYYSFYHSLHIETKQNPPMFTALIFIRHAFSDLFKHAEHATVAKKNAFVIVS